MIYTVTLNPSLDYIVRLDQLKPGYTNRAENERIVAGGKGINVSVALKNLGVKSTALGFAAGFTGLELLRQLNMMGIENEFIELEEGTTRINFKFVSTEETEVNGVGPRVHSRDIDHLYKILDVLADGDYLVLSGSVPSTVPNTIYEDIAGKAVLKGVNVVVDSHKKLLLNTLKYKPLLVKPNNKELGEMFNAEIVSTEDAVLYGQKLKEMGARNVMVSMGADGAVMLTESGEVLVQKAPEGKLINSVGAGDCMIAGFLQAYIENEGSDMAYALKKSVAAGSACAYTEGFPRSAAIEELLDRM